MRTPLIRPGSGVKGLEDVYAEHAHQRHELDKMLATACATESAQEKRRRGIAKYRSAAGDEDRLRHIPVHAPGVPGAIPGTRPDMVKI